MQKVEGKTKSGRSVCRKKTAMRLRAAAELSILVYLFFVPAARQGKLEPRLRLLVCSRLLHQTSPSRERIHNPFATE